MKRILLLWSILFCWSMVAFSQETFPRNGVKDSRKNAYAFTNATVVVNSTTTLNNATLLIKEGEIVDVGTSVQVPKGYTVIDVKGNYIYPSFIDLHSNYGLPQPERGGGRGWGSAEQIEPATSGAYNANDAIKSHYNANQEFSADERSAGSYRKSGFGAVLTFRQDGIARGTSAFVTLGNESDNRSVLSPVAGAHYSFSRGSSAQNFPVSAMGFIALLRQTYMDAEWYNNQKVKPFVDLSLESWIKNQSLPQFFEAGGWMTALRADKVGDEFGVQYVITGGGDEYQRIAEIKKSGATYLIPVNYPSAFDVEDPIDAEGVSLADMKHWEMAPANAAYLEKNGVRFAFTSHRSNASFLDNVRKAVIYGLSKKTALEALTTVPAQIINMDNRLGTLEKGKLANFIITSGDILDGDAKIYQNWIQGTSFEFSNWNEPDYSGEYTFNYDGNSHAFKISGNSSAEISINDSTQIKVSLKVDKEQLQMNFNSDGLFRLSGWKTANGFSGNGYNASGNWISWSLSQKEAADKSEKNRGDSSKEVPELGEVIYPFTSYGMKELPKQQTILIKNATVWTNEADGILTATDVLLKDGKIAKIGKNLSDAADRIIDGTGKHLTAGIIDEHSHIAASAINDVATNSSLVRIEDVLNSEDVDIYRALSGGVTAIQILHGSANPIGGQSALIKLRWGAAPEQLKIADADGFIKFALGENVKRSSSNSSIRFPQTRMGVEQVYVDAFTAAREYEDAWKAYNALSKKEKAKAVPPRKDITMETMLEILNGERFISCHSYVQSEINMLMKVAEQFGFRINTFTHILEGYKVADKMKEHGVGASTFSDWWNYKWEVRYAIPYNATILHNEGVLTAINSDDAEMMRRLNQEAAKSVKYGGMSQEDAMKLVTLNPAKLLHLDRTMGSVKVGKDADVVLWSDNPLSVYAKAEQTIIEGVVYFDIEKDKELRNYIQSERTRLIEKMKGEKRSGGPVSRRRSAEKVHFHCEDVLGIEADHSNH